MTTVGSVDWPSVVKAVATSLVGEPTSKTPTQWRFRRRGSLAINVAGEHAGQWYDFEAGAGGGGVDLVTHLMGCDRTVAVAWLQDQRLLPDVPGRVSSPHPIASPKPPAERIDPPGHADRISWARATWQMSEPVLRGPHHPVRRWLATRNLWHSDLPVPDGLRWLPAASERRRHNGVGSIVALAAEPMEWALSWPQLPLPRGVQLIAIAVDGTAAALETRSGWLSKQSRGVLTDCIAVFGNPIWEEATGSVRVAEGVADTLALASRYEGPAIATLGTGAMRSDSLASWLAGAPMGAVIHSDDDAGGQRAAGDLRRAVREAGGHCAAVLPATDDAKDPAAAAAFFPSLPPLPPEWRDYAVTLRDCNPTWPAWEVYRQVGVAFSAPQNGERA